MSRITFTSPSDSVDLCGRERANMGVSVDALALAALRLDGWEMRDRLLPLLPADHYLRTQPAGPGWANSARTAWRCGLTLTAGTTILDAWDLSLNTALAAGSDPIRLMARIHATCEIHGYVEGEHREWLADLIAEGRAANILRGPNILRDWGTWEGVEQFLRQTETEPVVMSYSATDSWPNGNVAGWQDNQDGDGWYDLGPDEQWAMAMPKLRDDASLLDLHPDTFRTRHFGRSQWTVYDLVNHLIA